MNEIELLRKIADEADVLWNKNLLPLEAIHLKNLLTDRADYNDRHNQALHLTPETETGRMCHPHDLVYCGCQCR